MNEKIFYVFKFLDKAKGFKTDLYTEKPNLNNEDKRLVDEILLQYTLRFNENIENINPPPNQRPIGATTSVDEFRAEEFFRGLKQEIKKTIGQDLIDLGLEEQILADRLSYAAQTVKGEEYAERLDKRLIKFIDTPLEDMFEDSQFLNVAKKQINLEANQSYNEFLKNSVIPGTKIPLNTFFNEDGTLKDERLQNGKNSKDYFYELIAEGNPQMMGELQSTGKLDFDKYRKVYKQLQDFEASNDLDVDDPEIFGFKSFKDFLEKSEFYEFSPQTLEILKTKYRDKYNNIAVGDKETRELYVQRFFPGKTVEEIFPGTIRPEDIEEESDPLVAPEFTEEEVDPTTVPLPDVDVDTLNDEEYRKYLETYGFGFLSQDKSRIFQTESERNEYDKRPKDTTPTETDDTTTTDETSPQPQERSTLGDLKGLIEGLGGVPSIIAGVMGARGYKDSMKKINVPDYPELSAAFKQHLYNSEQLAQIGFTPEEERAIRDDIDMAYRTGLDNLVRGTAGDRAKFLAGSGVLDANRSNALIKFAAEDARVKRENQANHTALLKYSEEYNANKSLAKRQEELSMQLQNKKAAGEFAASAFSYVMDGINNSRAMKGPYGKYLNYINNKMTGFNTPPLETIDE